LTVGAILTAGLLALAPAVVAVPVWAEPGDDPRDKAKDKANEKKDKAKDKKHPKSIFTKMTIKTQNSEIEQTSLQENNCASIASANGSVAVAHTQCINISVQTASVSQTQ
jgi:hypothetical protein